MLGAACALPCPVAMGLSCVGSVSFASLCDLVSAGLVHVGDELVEAVVGEVFPVHLRGMDEVPVGPDPGVGWDASVHHAQAVG